MLQTIVLSAVLTAQATHRVPGDHARIQDAIDAARAGDTVVVDAGRYAERLRLKGGVVLKSAGDDTPGERGLARTEATILDGGGKGEAPGVEMAEGAVLDGFTVTRVGAFDPEEFQKHWDTRGAELPDERGASGAGGEVPAVRIRAVTAVVRNCIVHDNGSVGVSCEGGKEARNASLVEGNVVYRNMGGGIGISAGAEPLVRANRCSRNLRAGIGIRASGGVVAGNDCRENVRAGIGMREGAWPVIRGNRCEKNRRAGIGCRMKGTRPRIEDNDCIGNGMAGIGSRADAEPFIRGNRCTGNEMAGIGLAPCTSGRARIVGNEVRDNALVALGINEGWRVTVSGNVLSRKAGMPPVVMVFEGAEADLIGNTITGPGVAGIRAAGRVRAVGNTFKGVGNPGQAVWGLKGADVALIDNTIEGFRHALVAQDASVTAVGNRAEGISGVGIRIVKPRGTAVVTRNRFTSMKTAKAVEVTEGNALVEENVVETGK